MSASTLGDYELGPVRGAGTVGTIYEATNRLTGEIVAVKRLHDAVSENELIRARFRREMAVLERLNHPNIIRFFGGGEDAGQLFYAMELVEGGTVKALLENRGRFPWQMVVDITRQVASALQHAHNNGVVHRDLKPGNLFLTSEGEVKLGDFGIARDLHNSDLTSSGMTVGTHAYMAPEQITGDQTLSGKADLYALGCCIFEMLTGEKPFYGDNYAQLFNQHLQADPPRIESLVSGCPDELKQLTYQLLAKKPEDRPFNARQVQAVMLQLDETFRPEVDTAEPGFEQASSKDVGAATVTSVGHEMLKKQIQLQMSQTGPAEITWGRLVAVLAALAAIIVAAIWAQQ
ncbi:MAG: serine/threonine-protein kinase [Planctomycetota bacterium]